MQAYRGQHQEPTDSKLPKDYIRGWKKSREIRLDGTVAGEKRRTTFWVRLGDLDVIALFYAFIERCTTDQVRDVGPEAILRLAQRLHRLDNFDDGKLEKTTGEFFSARIDAQLRARGVRTLRQLSQVTEAELEDGGFDRESLVRIEETLFKATGLRLS
jgi:hypothetical protein